MKWNRILPLVPALVLTGCADLQPQGVFRSTEYQHYEDAVRVEFYWNCSRPDARTVVIQGVAAYKPSAGTQIYYPTFTLVGLDRTGRVISRATGTTRFPIITSIDYLPWQVVLPLHGSEATFDLEYEYQWQEYGGGNGNRTGQRGVPRQGGIIPAAMIVTQSKVRNPCGGQAASGLPVRGANSFGTHSY